MMLVTLTLLNSILIPCDSKELRSLLTTAIVAWEGRVADVRAVRYCHSRTGDRCINYGGGAYTADKHEIWIDADFSFPEGETGKIATINHEYGHALGLNHTKDYEYSIMRSGWIAPWPVYPTEEDLKRTK